MIQESLDFLFHYLLAPKYLVKLGLLQEVIGIKYRHKRHLEVWQEHRDKSQKEILRVISTVPQKRKALIIGAGLLLDVPLKELSEEFEEVILVDIFFMQEALDQIKTYDNCRFEQLDISSTLKEAYYLWQNTKPDKEIFDSKLRNLILKRPNHFLLEENLDYVLSCNLLSQLPMAFESFAEKQKLLETPTLKDFTSSFCNNHIQYLQTFKQASCVHLLTDTHKIVIDKDLKELKEETSFDLDLIKDLKQETSWDWRLADFGELDKNHALKLKVQSFLVPPKL